MQIALICMHAPCGHCQHHPLTLYQVGSSCRQWPLTGFLPSRMSRGSVKKSQSRLARLQGAYVRVVVGGRG